MQKKPKLKVFISWWLSIIEAILVRYVKINEEWVAKVRESASKGPVIFVMRSRSLIDFLCIRGLCKRHNLPNLGFVSGISPFVFLPLWRWILALFRKRLPDRHKQRLLDTFEAGGSALVFLRRPAPGKALGSAPVEVDGIKLALEAQREYGEQVSVLPTVILWGEGAMHRLPRTFDFMLGTNEYPRLLRSLWLLIRRRSVHGAWIGDPVELRSLRHERKVGDDALAGVVKAGVGRRIEKIRRLRLGGLTKPSSRVKNEVLNSRRLKRQLQQICEKDDIPKAEIKSRARDIVEKLASDFKPRVLTLFAAVMAFVWRRIYNGLDVRQQDYDNLRAAVGKGPLLLLPDHKSHIDYMAISQVMAYANIMLPHIAAGDNLSFWPLGPLFRSSGAFFIRRKFVNDRFYTAVVNTYIRRLLQEGYSIEVFIEGGRSRTGKLLRPKLGMLEMTLNAMAATPSLNPGIMPTFIGYEKVIEEKSYVRELEGKKKKSESIGALLTTPKILFHRYGKLHVRTGGFFTVQEVLDELMISRDELDDGHKRRAAAQEVAMRVLMDINRISVATPSSVLSTVLLTCGSGPTAQGVLESRTREVIAVLDAVGADLTEDVIAWRDDSNKKKTIAGYLKTMVKDGRIKQADKDGPTAYKVRDNQRMALDYYKNNIIHFFAPLSIVSGICLADSQGRVSRTDIQRLFALASRLYRWEFFLPEYKNERKERFGQEVRQMVDRAVDLGVRTGILESADGDVLVKDPQRAGFISDILKNYHEIYLCSLRTLKLKVLGELTGDSSRLARLEFEQSLANGVVTKPEAKSRINLQNAFQSFKEMKINRPTSDEHPFDEGELGDDLIRLLEGMFRP